MERSDTQPLWKIIERIVAILEKALTPDAKVEHNVFLPVIGSPTRRSRQCDIVITYGQEPRQSFAIVEVQKRNSKPTITTFHGWLKKMEEVGAQQLICVSAIGYPKSIIEDVATRIGPTVTLMTLEELEASKPRPVFMLPNSIHTTPKYDIEEIGLIKLSEKIDAFECDTLSSKMISIGDNSECLSICEFISCILNQNLPQFFSGQGFPAPDMYKVEIVLSDMEMDLCGQGVSAPDMCYIKIVNNVIDTNVWLHYQNQKIRILNWSIKLRITTEKQLLNIPMTQFAYHQESTDGALAWVATTQMLIQNKYQEIQLVFKPDKCGYLQIALSNYPLSVKPIITK